MAQIAFIDTTCNPNVSGQVGTLAKGFANSSNDCKGHVFASRGKFIANKLSGLDIRRVQTTYEKRDGGRRKPHPESGNRMLEDARRQNVLRRHTIWRNSHFRKRNVELFCE